MMIPPILILIVCLSATLVNGQFESDGKKLRLAQKTLIYDRADQSSASVENNNINKQVTLQQNYETTQGPGIDDEENATDIAFRQEDEMFMLDMGISDTFNDSIEAEPLTSDEDAFLVGEDMTSTGTAYRTPATNSYVASSTIDHTLSDNLLQMADAQYQPRISKQTTTTTEEPFMTLVSSSPISTKPTSSQRHKMGKTIRTYKSSADQVLRQFVENVYLRHPLACIIDTTESNLRKAQMLWNATLRSNVPLDMLLSSYNSTGI